MDLVGFKAYLKTNGLAPRTCTVYLQDTAQYLKAIGDCDPRHIGGTQLQEYLIQLQLRQSTLGRKSSALRAFYRFLAETGELSVDPTLQLPTFTPTLLKRELLRIDQVEAILAATEDPGEHLAWRLFYGTGLSVDVLLGLTLKNIDFQTGELCWAEGQVLLDSPTWKLLIQQKLGTGRIFGLSRAQLLQRLATISKATLGFAITPRLLRNSFVAHSLSAEADSRILQTFLHHKSLATTHSHNLLQPSPVMRTYNQVHPRAYRMP